MPFTVLGTLPKFDRMEFLSPSDWRELGRNAVTKIVNRVRFQGLDANGQAFAPYSEGYRQAREEYGRPGSPVDLTVSGDMLNNLTVIDQAKTSVTLGWLR